MQDLQAKNSQLLMVSRRLGSDAERDKAALRAELEEEAASRMQRLAQKIDNHRAEREQQEVPAAQSSCAQMLIIGHLSPSRVLPSSARLAVLATPQSAFVSGTAAVRGVKAHSLGDQELMSTLVRQRDMFRQLFEQLSNRGSGDNGSPTPPPSSLPPSSSQAKVSTSFCTSCLVQACRSVQRLYRPLQAHQCTLFCHTAQSCPFGDLTRSFGHLW